MTDTAISPLRQRMIEDMKIRGFAEKTQMGYLRAVSDFAVFLGRAPDGAETEDLRRYQLHMRSRGASATSMNAAVSALTHHPHLHCVVPGGGISRDGTQWISCRPGFFLPVRVLSRLFRRVFLEKLVSAHDAGRLLLRPVRQWRPRQKPDPGAPTARGARPAGRARSHCRERSAIKSP